MHEPDQHVSPIKNWKQLVVVVALGFAVPIAIAAFASQWVTSASKTGKGDEAAVAARIQPVGRVQLATAAGPKVQMDGEQVYNKVCKTCHETGLAGAHKIGDKAAWGKVIAQGEKVTVEHAIKGIRAMPAKGGSPDLSDDEVARAVAYLAGKAGANWKAPAVAVAPPATPAAVTSERSGEEVVTAICSKCHATGEHGSPKIGDRTAWRERAKRGYKSVLQSALKGHSGMPARGGMAELSDAEIGRAVEFMMNAGADKPVVAATAAPAAGSAKPDGKKVYDGTCMVCHGAGVAGAPKFGDKAAWAPRLATGAEALYKTALGGKGAMPAKGGNASLSEADVKAAVDYMAAAAK
jgi:cytochrome c5